MRLLRLLRHRLVRVPLALVVAAAIWLPSLHRLFARDPGSIARPLAARQLALWQGRNGGVLEEQRRAMRAVNPEWDLMSRLFAVLAFANLAVDTDDPHERARILTTIDRVIGETIADEDEHGHPHFLLPYGRAATFRDEGRRSLFVDGEIALMLGARQLVERDPRHAELLRARVDRIARQIERSPSLLGESYPDETWIFCNTVALAAIRLHDVTSGDDHAELLRRWIANARDRLVDPSTGLLVSSTTWDGAIEQGPEGSTIWLAAHMLLLVDEGFARDQYARARRALGGGFLGFSWAREWPASWRGHEDVDSGPTVPIVDANAGSSGLAFLAARSFGDDDFVRGLVASLELGGFPIEDGAGRSYAAGNQLADAVILYGLVAGPLWERAGVTTEEVG